MKFIEIVKKDIELLQVNLLKHFEDTNYPFEDFEYFTYLEQSYTYNLITETLFTNKEDVLYSERIEQFKANFLKLKEEEFKNTNLLWIRVEHHHWFDIEGMLKNLYHYLLNEHTNGFKNLNLLLERSKQSFHNFLENKRLPIEIWIYLNGLRIDKTVNIDNEFDLIFLTHLLTVYPDGHSFQSIDFPYLIFKTKIKAMIKDDKENNDSIEPTLWEDWNQQWDKLNLILFSLYLSGLSFSYIKWELKPQWWIEYDLFDIKIPFENWEVIKPKAEEVFELHSVLESEKDIIKINEIREIIIKSNFMNNPKSQLLINRYFQIFDRKSTQDRILDEFIILESIYTVSNKSEVSFRLSLNIASFLGENKEDFEEINRFIKDIYSIRSAIVHGDEWKSRLRKREIKKHFNFENDSNYIANAAENLFLRLKQYIDKTILKIMEWEIENQASFFDKATGLFFINHRFH